jgi:flagellar protein FlaG
MAIKPIEAPTGIDLVRAASASAASSRNSQRSPARSPEARPAQEAQQPQQVAVTDQQAAGGARQNSAAPVSPNMRIHVDQDTGKTVVAIVNPEDGAVLRQVPSAEALDIAKAIGRYQGMFVNLKV